jgi:hypothetical protein
MFKIPKIILPVIRNVMPNLIAGDLCSVQSMTIDYNSVDQISDLEFEYPPFSRQEIKDWLDETSHPHVITKGGYKPRVTFKEAQGAVEFKLRFFEKPVNNLKSISIFTISK